MARVYYHGHGGLRIVSGGGTVCYIDPYLGVGYDLPADVVLVTHEHHDHTKLSLLTMKDDCTVIRAADMTDGVVYASRAVKDMTVRAVPAYNKNHNRAECVGYVIDVDGVRIYAAGDTSTTDYMEQMAEESIDYAFLPTDGVYNMDASEASNCAALINAKHSIPIHTYPEHLFDPAVAAEFKANGKITLMPGDELELK